MELNTINGFEEKQIFLLYDFLVACEESGITTFTSTKALLKEHPELSDLDEAMKAVKCHKSNAQEMNGVNYKSLSNEIYFTKRKNNLLSFLAHLRNSIAHGCAIEYDGKILVTDFEPSRYHPVNFTARGCVDFEIIKNMTEILKRIEL